MATSLLDVPAAWFAPQDRSAASPDVAATAQPAATQLRSRRIKSRRSPEEQIHRQAIAHIDDFFAAEEAANTVRLACVTVYCVSVLVTWEVACGSRLHGLHVTPGNSAG